MCSRFSSAILLTVLYFTITFLIVCLRVRRLSPLPYFLLYYTLPLLFSSRVSGYVCCLLCHTPYRIILYRYFSGRVSQGTSAVSSAILLTVLYFTITFLIVCLRVRLLSPLPHSLPSYTLPLLFSSCVSGYVCCLLCHTLYHIRLYHYFSHRVSQGTSADQDNRFSNKEKKLMREMKFSENLAKKVSSY